MAEQQSLLLLLLPPPPPPRCSSPGSMDKPGSRVPWLLSWISERHRPQITKNVAAAWLASRCHTVTLSGDLQLELPAAGTVQIQLWSLSWLGPRIALCIAASRKKGASRELLVLLPGDRLRLATVQQKSSYPTSLPYPPSSLPNYPPPPLWDEGGEDVPLLRSSWPGFAIPSCSRTVAVNPQPTSHSCELPRLRGWER